MVELIGTKRDGGHLRPEQIRWVMEQYTADEIPDYQMAALLMAVLLRGMDDSELAAWTEGMLHSGDVLDLRAVDKPKVDKHSTGGVGDKISIPLAPLVAACGVAVPMMSGRGLGHTGGTLDKLESIPGFSTDIDASRFVDQLNDIGVVMVGQTEKLVPADKRIYALRDATGTVPSIPLIASSIMSKKLSEDLDGLLLDVKVGSGAFMATREDAEVLAHTMVGIGTGHGTVTRAYLTEMSQPLGRAVGNAHEIRESIAVLEASGPADVTELTRSFAVEMVALAGIEDEPGAMTAVDAALASGSALEVLERLIAAQGGDPSVIEHPEILPSAPHRHTITASREGYVRTVDARSIGVASVRLGAGRRTKEDDIDPAVGFDVCVAIGDHVDVGDPLIHVDYRSEDRRDHAIAALQSAIEIADGLPTTPDLIMDVIT
jgi:pyrimidine-nucleoside phosphorylase